MAGIFNLFGEIVKPDKDQVVQSLSRSKTCLGVNTTSAKTFDQSKPKGLSIRSNSNINISSSQYLNSLNQDGSNKQEHLKLKLTQLNNSSCHVSPGKELVAKKVNKYLNKVRNESPNKIVMDKKNIKSQRPFDEDVFKKPLPPKKFIRKTYPEPENLAPYHDMQFEFDDIHTKTIENEFQELFMKKMNEMESYEDEGFISDPEPIEFDLPKFCTSPISVDEEWKKCCTLDLPEILDDDNF